MRSVNTAGELSSRLAAEVRAEMARQQINQQTLAQRLGRSQQWLSRRVTGEVPFDVADLSALSDALGVGPIDLLGRAA